VLDAVDNNNKTLSLMVFPVILPRLNDFSTKDKMSKRLKHEIVYGPDGEVENQLDA
jgi:hypothetical protein